MSLTASSVDLILLVINSREGQSHSGNMNIHIRQTSYKNVYKNMCILCVWAGRRVIWMAAVFEGGLSEFLAEEPQFLP